MTDKQYHKRLFNLTGKLARAASARPYDPDAYNDIIDELIALGKVPIKNKRVRPWGAICFCIFLIYCLAWLVWAILF